MVDKDKKKKEKKLTKCNVEIQLTGENTKLKCKLDEGHDGAHSEDKTESSADYAVVWTPTSGYSEVKGHQFEITQDETEFIEWTCVLCSFAISFLKDTEVEPHTTGTLPDNAGDYMDKCEYEES